MAKGKKTKSKPQHPKHELTEKEGIALQKQIDRIAASPESPRVRVTKGEVSQVSLEHPDQFTARGILMEALGTADFDFYNGLISQLADASARDHEADAHGLNFMLSVIKDIKPKDQLEAMLAAQLAAVHMTVMGTVRRLTHADTLQQQDSAGALLTKLLRTFAAQMEALKRYRTGGEQKVTVQHVTVGEGGQAIVGNVTQAPQESTASQRADALLLLTDAKSTPMPLIKESKPAHAARRTAK
jgi:hypothetical protein